MAIGAVAFGVVAMVLASAFVEWVLWAMRETTIRSHVGHLQVAKAGYRELGTANPHAYLLRPDPNLRSALEQLPGALVVAPRVEFSGIVSLGDATLSFAGEGVDPEREVAMQRTLRLPRAGVNVVSGQDLAAGERNVALLGEGLAANLGAKVGNTVVLVANTASGGINAVEVKVTGIFSTISKAYDDSAIRVPVQTARALLRVEGDHRLLVVLDQTERAGPALLALRAKLEASKIEITPWYELTDFYNKTAELFAKQTAVVKVIIAVIIVLGISNTMMMSTLERTGEIGTSMALGVPRRRILGQFLTEGAVLGVLGGVIGVTLGALGATVISAIGIPMPPPPGQSWGYTGEMRLTASILGGAFTLAVLTTVVASVYPAWKASRLLIVDALRFNR